MKKLFLTAVIILAAVCAIPAVGAFADTAALEDIPMLNQYYTRGGESKKAYCYYEYDGEFYTYTYYNCETKKILHKSENKFEYCASISEDGKTAFYVIDNAVYRYAYGDGKPKKIYEAGAGRLSAETSPSGEYCLIRAKKLLLWHGGKTVSAVLDKDTSICGVTDDGKLIYADSDGKIFSFSFETEKSEKLAELSDGRYIYGAEVFYGSGTYLFYGYNGELQDDEDDDPEYNYCKVIYGGRLNEKPRLIYSGSIGGSNIKACNGRSLLIYDNNSYTRISLENGKSKKLYVKQPESVNKACFYCSDDLSSVVYIDHSVNKLVRLSKWSVRKNAYTKRQEIQLSGTEPFLGSRGKDMKIVEVLAKDESGEYQGYAAYFESGSLVPANDIIRIDRFDNVICGSQNSDKLEILNPDGSRKKVFAEKYEFYSDDKSGYFIFGTKEATAFDEGLEMFGIYHDYYIDKNGKAIPLWDGRNTYEITYAEDWD